MYTALTHWGDSLSLSGQNTTQCRSFPIRACPLIWFDRWNGSSPIFPPTPVYHHRLNIISNWIQRRGVRSRRQIPNGYFNTFDSTFSKVDRSRSKLVGIRRRPRDIWMHRLTCIIIKSAFTDLRRIRRDSDGKNRLFCECDRVGGLRVMIRGLCARGPETPPSHRKPPEPKGLKWKVAGCAPFGWISPTGEMYSIRRCIGIDFRTGPRCVFAINFSCLVSVNFPAETPPSPPFTLFFLMAFLMFHNQFLRGAPP